ncbi:MAG TPA: immune inhibitor A domain-containing protein [Stackebrandtia sp.]|uniref:immune inhibitor A domain-containing protein n=1 Tax=Stackebrandtia sp. TaxID=2023065 RepID=UPI002D63562D|nr:immune inhibitor A domain-containing protein [Stackebrandtia sp.]HZE41084.1 immune inhibitor A domain-containing protein [Stackebrandtia sp.]
MVKTRYKALSAIAAAALVAVGVVTVQASADPAPGRESTDRVNGPVGENLPLSPQQADLDARRRAALEKVATGAASADKNGAVKVDKDEYADTATTGKDEIFTLLVEFGDKTGDPGGKAGPTKNKIPEPDRSKDNSTLWNKDFNQDYYQNMLFGPKDSMPDFYTKQSGGKYTVDGKVQNWVTVPYNEARYGHNGDENEGYPAFVQDSVKAWYDAQVAAGQSADQIKQYLAQFDKQDRYDYDGDGDFNEPDGYVDHIQIIHAGEGEEAGGGAEGADAIWSHRSYAVTDQPGPDNNPQSGAPLGDSGMWVGDYTTEPENGGIGVFSHEFGHDLGLPDLYDTTGNADNNTGRWSLMSGGSWLNDGKDSIGNKPGFMGPWEKYFLGWLTYDEVSADTKKQTSKLGPAGDNGSLPEATKVDLPDSKQTVKYPKPASGTHEWMAGDGDKLNSTLTRTVDLSDAKKSASVDVKAYIDTEKDYDFFYGEVSTDNGGKWTKVGDSYSGATKKYTDISEDLSKYIGKKIKFRFHYESDTNTHGQGVFLDDVALKADGKQVWLDDVESPDPAWDAMGFSRTDGTEVYRHARFYLAENRRYVSYDTTLKVGPYNFGFGDKKPNWVERYPYQDGMLVWYVNTTYTDNNVSAHKGSGLVLPVDAHSSPLKWKDGTYLSNTHQAFDATFSKAKTDKLVLHKNGTKVSFAKQKGISVFDDSKKDGYWSSKLPTNSVKVAGLGVKITIVTDSKSKMVIKVTRK